ncbi:MAG: hypothetical protein ACRCZI_04085, partial [Cetobacterium sp.]
MALQGSGRRLLTAWAHRRRFFYNNYFRQNLYTSQEFARSSQADKTAWTHYFFDAPVVAGTPFHAGRSTYPSVLGRPRALSAGVLAALQT